MADNKCVAVPLLEQLRSIPRDAVLRIDTPNALGCMDTRSIPVGRLCHEAAKSLGEAELPVCWLRLVEVWGGFPRHEVCAHDAKGAFKVFAAADLMVAGGRQCEYALGICARPECANRCQANVVSGTEGK